MIFEKHEKEFNFDGIFWMLKTKSGSRREYVISKIGIMHPFFANTIEYMNSITHNPAFIAWIGCTERSYVWDVYPIIKFKEDEDGNSRVDIDNTKIVAYRMDGIVDSIQYVPACTKNNFELGIRYTIPSKGKIADFYRKGDTKHHDMILLNGYFDVYSSMVEPYFWRIEGEASFLFDEYSIIHSSAMSNALIALKQNVVGAAIVSGIRKNETTRKMTKEELIDFSENFDFNSVFVGDPQMDYEDQDTKFIKVKFYIVRSHTTDGYPMLGISPNLSGSAYTSLKSSVDASQATFSSVMYEYPEDYDFDLKDRLDYYLSIKMSNIGIDHLTKHWVIPYACTPKDLQYNKDSSNMYDLVLFNDKIASLHFFEKKLFKEEKVEDKLGIHDLYFEVKKVLGSFHHYVLSRGLIANDYVIKNKVWADSLKVVVKITDYFIPASHEISEDSLKGYFRRIQKDIKETLDANPTWDYIPIQGFDILSWDNPFKTEFSDPIDCAVRMYQNHELVRYSVLWGDFSKMPDSDRPNTRKQIHNHPVFPVGGRCVWIFR